MFVRSRKLLWILVCIGALIGREASAQELAIAAASDLSAVFKELAANYEKQTGTHVKLSFGSSGNFFAQIQNGAPFDLFFSADISYPQKLESAELTEPGSLYKYALGRIVLWTPRDSKIDVAVMGMKALFDPAVHKIAIANPSHAPYGRAAVAAIEHFGMTDKVRDKLVFGENISQATQFVETGNAEIGFTALSLALSPALKDKGKYWEIPVDAYPPLQQGAVILKSSKNKQAAKAFLSYLKGAGGIEVIKRYGFVLPSEPAARAPRAQ